LAISGTRLWPSTTPGTSSIAWAQKDSVFNHVEEEIYAQRFDSAGQPDGGELMVNTVTEGYQLQVDVSMAGDGRAIVVWRSEPTDPEHEDVYGQRFDSSGAKVGGEIAIGGSGIAISRPAVAFSDSGEFVVAWQQSYDIVARRFAANGAPIDAPFPVNTETTYGQEWPDVAIDDVGNFAIVWQSAQQDGTADGIYAQLYASGGTRDGGEFRVNVKTDEDEEFPVVTMSSSDQYIFVWGRYLVPSGGMEGLYGRFLSGPPGTHANTAPIAIGDDYATDEDTPLDVPAPGVLGSDSDPDGDALTAALETGVSHGTLVFNGDGSFSYTPELNYNGPDNFTYTASDGALASNIATVTIDVASINDAPVVSAGGSYSGEEARAIALDGASADDLDGDSLSYSWISDGPCTFSDPNALMPTLACDDDGAFTATLTVDDGLTSSSSDAALTVVNVAPTAEFAASPTTSEEGSNVTLAFSNQTDASAADTSAGFDYSYDCDGDGAVEAGGIDEDQYTCTYADDGTFAARGRIEDKDGGYTDYTVSVTVDNVAPTIDAIVAPVDPVAIDTQPLEVAVEFSDPGTADTHTTVIDWGDGSTDTLYDPSPIVATHTYADTGVYTLGVSVTDDAAGTASATYEYVVVYDPDRSVTGHGSIISPAGSCQLDDLCATAEGTARVGFVARYPERSTVPTGHTFFRFRPGGLHFQSDTYDLLVVDQGGTTAQLGGTGLISRALAPNGSPYRFTIWATDGAPDTFRIKIWYQAEGTEIVVYDNGSGQPIENGAIRVRGR
jgi:hypothetical protein